MKIIAVMTSRLLLIFAEIPEKFPEILNFRKTYNPIGLCKNKWQTVTACEKYPVLTSLLNIVNMKLNYGCFVFLMVNVYVLI